MSPSRIVALCWFVLALPVRSADPLNGSTFHQDCGRSGVAVGGPAMRTTFPADLEPVWVSQGPDAATGWGAGSPVVVDRKVYVYATMLNKDPGNMVLCFDLETGKEVWRRDLAGKNKEYGNHCTPAVAEGKLVVGGADGEMWCLDAKTGADIWSKPKGDHGPGASSPLIHGGQVFCGRRKVAAFALSDGAPLWNTPSGSGCGSPALWLHGGVAYVISLIEKPGTVVCLQAKDGKKVWQFDIEGELKNTTPAVNGEVLAVVGGKGLFVLRLAPDKATLIGRTADGVSGHGGAAAVNAGTSIYHGVRGGCVRLDITEQGLKEVWRNKTVVRDGYSTPVLADGKLFGLAPLKGGSKEEATYVYPISYTSVVVVDAATGRELGNVGAKLGICMVSPCVADGRVVIRGPKGLACFDLRAK